MLFIKCFVSSQNKRLDDDFPWEIITIRVIQEGLGVKIGKWQKFPCVNAWSRHFSVAREGVTTSSLSSRTRHAHGHACHARRPQFVDYLHTVKSANSSCTLVASFTLLNKFHFQLLTLSSRMKFYTAQGSVNSDDVILFSRFTR